jgi:glycosyltransferase involved in cell wall biosynthesis
LEFRYVIAGALDQPLDIPGLIRRLGLADWVLTPGWVEEEAFFTLARAADLLVNLRFPVGGESSGTLARALGMGLPALVFDLGPAAEWPDQAVVKLPFAANPLPGLRAALGRLLADRAGLVARGRLAQMLARAGASVHRSAAATLAAVDAWG